jgi:glycerol-3-phosphate dehydrogenase (NAD(P)+)
MRVEILGAGSWGTALALLLARNGAQVVLRARNPEEIEAINAMRENRHYLAGFPLPNAVVAAPIEPISSNADLTVIAVPSAAVRSVVEVAGAAGRVLVASKGFESDTARSLVEVVRDIVRREDVGVLSGPNLAIEIARGIPTVAVAAFVEREHARAVQVAFTNTTFRVSVSADVVGVELAGALKNVLAIGAGMSDGLGFGDNTKGALLARGLMEMAKLGLRMGGRLETFLGPAGAGDLFATATSRLSRNYRYGLSVGQGELPAAALASIGQVVEGVASAGAASALAERYSLELPVMQAVAAVIAEKLSPADAVAALMHRLPRTVDFFEA